MPDDDWALSQGTVDERNEARRISENSAFWFPAQFFGYESDPPLSLVPKRHRASLIGLSAERWIGARDGGPQGNTQDALERLGVAEVRWAKKPYPHQQIRLTEIGRRYIEAHLS